MLGSHTTWHGNCYPGNRLFLVMIWWWGKTHWMCWARHFFLILHFKKKAGMPLKWNCSFCLPLLPSAVEENGMGFLLLSASTASPLVLELREAGFHSLLSPPCSIPWRGRKTSCYGPLSAGIMYGGVRKGIRVTRSPPCEGSLSWLPAALGCMRLSIYSLPLEKIPCMGCDCTV